MPGICRDNDTAGGDLISSQSTVFANGQAVITDADSIVNHGDNPHNNAKITANSNNVFVGGKAVCNAGDVATCGHVATGSSNVNVGD